MVCSSGCLMVMHDGNVIIQGHYGISKIWA